MKGQYSRANTQKYSNEIFVVDQVKREEINSNIIRYILKDVNGNLIERKFYHQEVKPVKVTPKSRLIGKIAADPDYVKIVSKKRPKEEDEIFKPNKKQK